ncbi:MAG TPA: PAS domain S-box protein [Waterburya sp.]
MSHKKLIIVGLRIVLFLLSSVTVLFYGSLITRQPIVGLLSLSLIVAIANSLSVVLLGWIYALFWQTLSQHQELEDAVQPSQQGCHTAVDNFLDTFVSDDAAHRIGFVHDITQSTRAEQQSDRFFNLPLDMLAIRNMEGYFTHLNPAWETTLGFTLDELKAQPCIVLVHPDDVAATQAAMVKLGAGIPVTQLENRYRCKDGSYKWLSWTAIPFLEEGLTYSIARDISGKKQAEVALLQANEELEIRVAQRTVQLRQANTELSMSEERFRTSIENMLDCFGIYTALRDESGQIVDFLIEYVNAAACANNCMTREEQIGKRLCELLPAHQETELFSEYVKLVEIGQPLAKESVDYEDTYKGQRLSRTFDIRAVKLGDGFAVAWRDITERKQAEELRGRTEELYRAITHNFPNGAVILFDHDLRYTLAEGKGLAEVGLTKELLEGKTIWENFSPEICNVLELYYQAALEDKINVFEINYYHKTYLVHVLPVKNNKEEIFAGLAMTQDITERKRAELELLEERNFVSAILDTANALIVVLDEQGKIVRFNRACEQITGYFFEEVKGRYFWDFLLIPEEVEPVTAVFQELLSANFPNEYENYWVARDGSRRLVSWSNTVLFDSDGLIKYIIGIGIDITERKQAEEMRRALEREQELSELRLRFFSLVSHEFRTPLSTILLTAQILESSAQGWSEEKRKRNFQRIVLAVKEMRQMLDDILTINRAETGKLEFEPTQIDLNSFCQNLLEQMRLYTTDQHHLIFSQQGQINWVFFDEKLLSCILSKFLMNAIKYSPQGGEIKLISKVDQRAIVFDICDKGIGISLSEQSHIFEAFHRGDNIGSIPGSGLGLTVVQKCLEVHKGSISLSSEVGVGTTFTVTIPLNQTED